MMDARTRERKKKEVDIEAIRIHSYSKAGRGKEGEKSKVMGYIMKGRQGEDEDIRQSKRWRC